MKPQDFRSMKIDELCAKRDELTKESFNLRMQHRLGQLDNQSKLRVVRKDIARVETIIREKQRES